MPRPEDQSISTCECSGHRSALEWVIDQYQRKETSNPNRSGDPEYIVRLVGQVIAVSLETVAITNALPPYAVAE